MEEPALEVAAKRLAEHRAQRLVGRQLGSYQVVAFLDAGAMGEVYRARDTKLECEVAIKVATGSPCTRSREVGAF